MLRPDRPIPYSNTLRCPQGVELKAAERWVRNWTRARIDLSSEAFSGFGTFDVNDAESRKRRAKVLKFAIALQRHLLKYENWDGTRKPHKRAATHAERHPYSNRQGC